MMRVVLSPRAQKELEDAANWWAENRSSEQALRWYAGFISAIESLAENPERFPTANENDQFAFEIREMHFGLGANPTHRALFTIRPDMVYVFLIRHVAQREITPDDL